MPLLGRDEAERFLGERNRGVLVTLRRDGRPQLSNVMYGLVDGAVRVSTTADRAKSANASRDPRVALHVTSDDFWTYVVAEGQARLSPVASEPGDDTCRALLDLYDAISDTPHPDPDEFYAAMVAERRHELSFAPDNLYPLRD